MGVPLPFNSSWHRGHTDSSLLGQHRDIPQVDENNMMRSGSSMLPAKHGRYSNIPWLTSHSNTLQSAADQSPAFFKKPNTDVTSPWKPLLHTSMPIDPYSKNPAQMKASYHKTVLIDTGMMPTDIKNKLQKNEKAQFESSFGCTGVLRSEDMTAPLPHRQIHKQIPPTSDRQIHRQIPPTSDRQIPPTSDRQSHRQ